MLRRRLDGLFDAAQTRSWLAVILIAGLVLRVAFVRSQGFATDAGDFSTWAVSLASHHLANFYASTSFADYPPGYLYVLWTIGELYAALAPHGNPELLAILVKSPAILMDFIDGALLFVLVRRIAGDLWAIIVCAAFTLNPAVIFISAVWGQVDSVALAFVLVAIIAQLRTTDGGKGVLRDTVIAWFALSCSILIKPQAVCLAPLFLAAALCAKTGLRTRILAPVLGIASGVVSAYVIALPFHPTADPLNVLSWLYHQYETGSRVYPYNSVNAFNLWTVLHPFWQRDLQQIGPIPQYAWGIVLVCAAVVLVVFRYAQQRTERAFIEAAALIGLAFFMLATRMHERYIYDGLVLAMCAMPFARRYVAGAATFSITLLVNLFYSLRYLSVVTHGVAGVNQTDMWGAADHLISLVNVGVFFWLAYTFLGEEHVQSRAARPAKRARGRTAAGSSVGFDANEGRAGLAWPIDYVVCAALTTASFVILYVRFWFPPGKIFDEVYFARAAEEYLHRQYIYENTHPPVTKLLITLSTLMFGDNSYGWRFLDVVFGAAAIWLLYALLKRVTGSTLFSAYGAGLFMFDGMHFVQSRIATPESFVVVFALLTVYTFYRWWIASQVPSEHDPGTRPVVLRAIGAGCACVLGVAATQVRFPHESAPAKAIVAACLIAGLYLVSCFVIGPRKRTTAGLWLTLFAFSIALLVASKWYGVMAFGVAFTIVFGLWLQPKAGAALQRLTGAAAGPSRWGNPNIAIDAIVATIVFVVVTVYFAAYIPQFVGLSDTPGAPPRAYTVTDVVNMQYAAFEYHDHLVATHPYQSRWWQWPLDLRPILYYSEYGGRGATATAAMIYTLANPLILWLGLLTVPLVAYLGLRERSKGYVLIALTYVAQWLPWMGSPRISFAYHFYVDIPLICACTAIVMQRWWILWRDTGQASAGKWLIGGYFGAATLAFVYFYPILSGLTIPSAAWMQRMWLHSWI